MSQKRKAVSTASSGNVFDDLGLADSDELLAKTALALRIREAIRTRKLTQVQAAEILGLDQPKVSSIVNGRLEGYSAERLMRFLTDLGCDVKITISAPHPRSRGHLILAG
jgi:predicted XRE-type DNA-binding protein